jgi:hypothetical protein
MPHSFHAEHRARDQSIATDCSVTQAAQRAAMARVVQAVVEVAARVQGAEARVVAAGMARAVVGTAAVAVVGRRCMPCTCNVGSWRRGRCRTKDNSLRGSCPKQRASGNRTADALVEGWVMGVAAGGKAAVVAEEVTAQAGRVKVAAVVAAMAQARREASLEGMVMVVGSKAAVDLVQVAAAKVEEEGVGMALLAAPVVEPSAAPLIESAFA